MLQIVEQAAGVAVEDDHVPVGIIDLSEVVFRIEVVGFEHETVRQRVPFQIEDARCGEDLR